MSYDKYPPNADQIHRLVLSVVSPDRGMINTARTPPPWAPAITSEIPGVRDFVRFKTPMVSWMISYEEEDKVFHEKGFYFADPSVFNVFGYKLLKGNPETALIKPQTVVITQSTAKRYFGNQDPVGLVLRADNTYDFTITGIMQDVPDNSHIQFDFLASFESLNVLPIYNGTNYEAFDRTGLLPDVYTYLLIDNNINVKELETQISNLVYKYLGDQIKELNLKLKPELQSLKSIHLYSNLEAELRSNSNIDYIYIFLAVGLIILAIACVNFMNLATITSANRTREIGMRKVVGAYRWQLIIQFLGESVLISLIAFLISIAIVQPLLPVFNSLSGKNLVLDITHVRTLLEILMISIILGLLAGSYPAFFLASFRLDPVLRGEFRTGPKGTKIRTGLVLIQFVGSSFFIIGTLVVNRQMNYIHNKNLGFDKEQVVVVPMGDPRARPLYITFKENLKQIPEIRSVSSASSVPGGLINNTLAEPEGRPVGENVVINELYIDHDFITTLQIKVINGRDFSVLFPSDTLTAFIVNKAAVLHFGWGDRGIGKKINIGNFKKGRVIGIVDDFHVKSLYHRIEPVIMHIAPNPVLYLYILIRIRPGDISATLNKIEKHWYLVYPQDQFIYSFLDQDYDRLYRSEDLWGRVFASFSFLAIFIACLGLFGLASYTAEISKVGIGVRKVFGASAITIVLMLSGQFARLIIVANLIAWPLAHLILNKWLQNFAYRSNIPFWIYLLAFGISLLIAILTISYQAFRAANKNPAISLRHE